VEHDRQAGNKARLIAAGDGTKHGRALHELALAGGQLPTHVHRQCLDQPARGLGRRSAGIQSIKREKPNLALPRSGLAREPAGRLLLSGRIRLYLNRLTITGRRSRWFF
jgi:hypothetical protein